jgi:farnesyl diphosphate synthase
MAQQTTIDQFEAVFPKLEKVLLEHAESYKLPTQALDWYKNVSDRCC